MPIYNMATFINLKGVFQRRGFARRCVIQVRSAVLLLALILIGNIVSAQDCDKNWVLTRNYDENGNEISTTKAFFDNNGKSTQTQVKNESTSQVFANQTLYDLQGRGVVNTLSAPINSTMFKYSNGFVTANSQPYNFLNFDGDPSNSNNPYAKVNSSDALDNTQPGTLGWYYSNNNTLEPMVGATGFPYSRVDYYHDGTSAVKRSAGIGEQLKMGAGHEVASNSFPVQHELDQYLAIRNQFFPVATAGIGPSTLAGQALQSLSTDQNGTSVLSVTDISGKQRLMSGRADPTGWLTVQNTVTLNPSLNDYEASFSSGNGQIIRDSGGNPIRVCQNCPPLTNPPPIPSISISSGNMVSIYKDNQLIYSGVGNAYQNSSPADGNYVIRSLTPFIYNIGDNDVNPQYIQSPTTSVQYFILSIPSVVNITGTAYTLYNMKTETDITSGFTNGGTLPAGYYKITASLPADNSTNPVTVTYANKYADISYNYYNQLGQLIANITPNGVQQLIQNGYSSYTSASQLPFVTLYQYDLQGRLTSVSTPDGGLSQYVYRKDGQIRFSQNVYQKVAANAGSGKVEKFSYTNYDTFGRPVESGEYAVASPTFAGLTGNTALLEATGISADIAGATKLSQVNTYYDLPAANLSLTGYTQDAGFLKGAVSYTTNANSSTWYNYDDHGRVVWMVKQIAGLTGYKTVNYTYNDQGNVSVVEYQRGNAAERFLHYYTYDADARLINVQTSTDGVNMVQQAHYYYYLHGPLKRTELGDQLQGIDYTYTPQGWLKAINSPTGDPTKDPLQDGVSNSFAKDAFGLQLEYFNGDYTRNGSNITSIPTGSANYFNGNVTGMSWQSNKPTSVVSIDPTIQNPTMYAYAYDAKYQFNRSTWGTPNYSNGTFNPATKFAENGITYDANGNIQTLQRTDGNGALSDNFSKYTYTANTNKLASVGSTGSPTAYAAYTYDELGRLKSELQPGATGAKIYLQYDVTGKVTGIYSDAAMTALVASYTYDEAGNRIKVVNSLGTTYYVYDPSGNVLALYKATTALPTPALAEQPVYGSDRLGTYFKSAANYVYELRDNVGSVRVAINRNKVSGQADIIQYNDYYPYGFIARKGGVGYHYEYQGLYAEKDPITGFNNFDLRFYDSRIGRWLTVDPAGQYASPYEGMGNNPVNRNDPDGGIDGDGDPPTVKSTSTGYITSDITISDTRIQRPTISEYHPGFWAAWDMNKSFLGKLSYSLLDNPWVFLQQLAPGRENPTHLGGRIVTRGTESVEAGVNSLAMLLPMGRATAATESGVTVFRSMTEEAAEVFLKTGEMPAGTETFFSFSEKYASQYDGVLFRIKLAPGTVSELEQIGVRNSANLHPFPDLPLVKSGWKASNAFFKVEGDDLLNIGLGNGRALDIFNANIRYFTPIK